MAYNLSREKKLTVIRALVEGVSIRSIERMTGVREGLLSLRHQFSFVASIGCVASTTIFDPPTISTRIKSMFRSPSMCRLS